MELPQLFRLCDELVYEGHLELAKQVLDSIREENGRGRVLSKRADVAVHNKQSAEEVTRLRRRAAELMLRKEEYYPELAVGELVIIMQSCVQSCAAIASDPTLTPAPSVESSKASPTAAPSECTSGADGDDDSESHYARDHKPQIQRRAVGQPVLYPPAEVDRAGCVCGAPVAETSDYKLARRTIDEAALNPDVTRFEAVTMYMHLASVLMLVGELALATDSVLTAYKLPTPSVADKFMTNLQSDWRYPLAFARVGSALLSQGYFAKAEQWICSALRMYGSLDDDGKALHKEATDGQSVSTWLMMLGEIYQALGLDEQALVCYFWLSLVENDFGPSSRFMGTVTGAIAGEMPAKVPLHLVAYRTSQLREKRAHLTRERRRMPREAEEDIQPPAARGSDGAIRQFFEREGWMMAFGHEPGTWPCSEKIELHDEMLVPNQTYYLPDSGYESSDALVKRVVQLLGDFTGVGPQDRWLDIADLGCGSGKYGVALRGMADYIWGLECASAVLDDVDALFTYDDVDVRDIATWVHETDNRQSCDVVLAVGVSNAFGVSFQEFIAGVAGVLRPWTGIAVFTFDAMVEAPEDMPDAVVFPKGHFIHSRAFVMRVLGSRFRVEHMEEFKGEQWVAGLGERFTTWLVIARRLV